MDTPTAPERGLTARVDRLLGYLWRWGAVLAISGWLLGVSLYPLLNWEQAEYLLENNLEAADRSTALKYGLMGVVFVAALYVVVWYRARRKDRSLGMDEAFTRFTRVWFVSLTAPLVAGLLAGGMEKDAEVLAMFFIVIVMGFVMTAVHLRPPPADPELAPDGEPKLELWYRDRYFRWVAGLCVAYGLAMTYLSLMDHWSIATHAFDLGIYDNIMWNTVNGAPLDCSMCRGGDHSAAHFDPLLIVLSPLYRMYPHAETLLILQAWWVAASGIPLYLVARRALPEARRYCVGVVALFFLHPATHGVNLFDFHSLALCIPLVLWCIHCIDAKSRVGFVVAFTLLMLNREDMPLYGVFIALYAITRGRPIWGALTIVFGIAYLYVVKTQFMPDSGLLMQSSSGASSYTYYYEDMVPERDEGMKGLVLNTFSNPVFVFKVIFLNTPKNQYIFGLLVPLLFLPFFGRSKRVLLLYPLAFIGLASRKHVYSYHFQYSAVLLPALMVSIPEATKRVTAWAKAKGIVPSEAHLRRTMMWGMMTGTILLGARFGAFVPNASFKGGWNRLNRWLPKEDRERLARVREMAAQIPRDAVVSATSALVPHVSNRAEIHKFPAIHYADYLLLYISKVDDEKKYRGKLRRIRRDYVTVDEYDGIELFRRVAPVKGEEPTEEWLELERQRKQERKVKRDADRKKKDTAKPSTTRKPPPKRPAITPREG